MLPVASSSGLVNALLESVDVALVSLPGQRPPVFRRYCYLCHKTRTLMNTFTILSTGHTSAYLCHYARLWLLVPSRPLRACGWSPARALTPHESHPRVTPFRVSILCDRRVVLYAGSRSSEYQVSAWQPGRRPIPFGPAIQPLGRVCMTTPLPHLYSSLPIVTCSTGRRVRLAAFRLSFPLSTRPDQFRAEGRCCLSFTGEARVDVR